MRSLRWIEEIPEVFSRTYFLFCTKNSDQCLKEKKIREEHHLSITIYRLLG